MDHRDGGVSGGVYADLTGDRHHAYHQNLIVPCCTKSL